MIKAIFFDLDGVLFDGRVFHRDLFLMTAKEFGLKMVDEEYHDTYLDGLSTRQKIDILIEKSFKSMKAKQKRNRIF